jgi:hypothetical protein
MSLPREPDLGSGISRPTGRCRTRKYRVRVFNHGARPLLVQMQAENKRSALKYAANRWPGAVVEVVD